MDLKQLEAKRDEVLKSKGTHEKQLAHAKEVAQKCEVALLQHDGALWAIDEMIKECAKPKDAALPTPPPVS